MALLSIREHHVLRWVARPVGMLSDARLQVAFLVDVAMTTYVVRLGLGKRMWDFPMENLPKFALPIIVRGTFAITSIVWSKTAFSVTLLRLTDGWTRWLVWYILISTNIALGLSALLPWVQCKPLAAAWDITVVGTCWPKSVGMSYNLFSGGEICVRPEKPTSIFADLPISSLLGRNGLCPGAFTVEASHEPQYPTTRKVWRSFCNERRCLVCCHLPSRQHSAFSFYALVADKGHLLHSAGIAAIVKTTKIPTLYGDDMCMRPPASLRIRR